MTVSEITDNLCVMYATPGKISMGLAQQTITEALLLLMEERAQHHMLLPVRRPAMIPNTPEIP